jgi:hypothetical protein
MLNSLVDRNPAAEVTSAARVGIARLLAFALLIVVIGWYAQTGTLNHDTGWYLQATRIWLEGGALYQDIIEINPPLAFVLHLPPVLAAGLFDASPITAFFIWLFALMGASMVLCDLVVARLPLSRSEQTGLLAVVLAGLVLGSWQGVGQREHFMMILVAPYLLIAVARATGADINRYLALAIGVVAALGFGLKPHFLLVPAALELYLRVSTRRSIPILRPETIGLAAFLGAYLVVIALATPLYFTRIVPWGLLVYDALSGSAERLLHRHETVFLPLVIGACIWFRVVARRRDALQTVAEVFVLSALCFWIIYLVQMKGFSYHRFPVRTAMIVGLGSMVLFALDDAKTKGRTKDLRVALGSSSVSVLFVFMLVWLVMTGGYWNLFIRQGGLSAMKAHAASGARSLYVFSSHVWEAFPASNYARLRTVSRYPTQWLLPGLMRREANAGASISAADRRRIEKIKRFVLESVIEDFRRGKPDLVMVDVRANKPYFDGISFDYLAYFKKDPRFAAIWSHYRLASTMKGFEYYRRRR